MELPLLDLKTQSNLNSQPQLNVVSRNIFASQKISTMNSNESSDMLEIFDQAVQTQRDTDRNHRRL